jgi:hypothetical protein
MLLPYLWGWGEQLLAVHPYGCGLSATVQKPSNSGNAHCCSSDALQMQAEKEALHVTFGIWIVFICLCFYCVLRVGWAVPSCTFIRMRTFSHCPEALWFWKCSLSLIWCLTDAGRERSLTCYFWHLDCFYLSTLLLCLWGWGEQLLAVHPYECGLSATVQKLSDSGNAYCCSFDASQMQAEKVAFSMFIC